MRDARPIIERLAEWGRTPAPAPERKARLDCVFCGGKAAPGTRACEDWLEYGVCDGN